MRQLNEDFLIELAKACCLSKDFLETIKMHLKFSSLPNEPYKNVFKIIFDHYDATEKAPSIGVLAQFVNNEQDTLAIIAKIRVTVDIDKVSLLAAFETFLKRSRFVALHAKVKEMFNEQNHDEAIDYLAQESQAINEFTLSIGNYTRLYRDYETRDKARSEEKNFEIKVPIGIPAFDCHTRGGIEKGTALLGIGFSGIGKSTFLRWVGHQASLRRYNVLHLQAEGIEATTMDAYDAMWTSVPVHDIKEGKISSSMRNQISKALKHNINSAGEVYIRTFDQFGTASILDCRRELIELLKVTTIDVVIFDYLELFDPGDGKRYGTDADSMRALKTATARKIVNIATEFDVVAATMTQASHVQKAIWDVPTYVLTRDNIANLKATIDPFAYCVTLNQTSDENDSDVIRISEEKLREYKVWGNQKCYRIAQDRDVGRFMDVKKTNELYWDAEKNRIKGMDAKHNEIIQNKARTTTAKN